MSVDPAVLARLPGPVGEVDRAVLEALASLGTVAEYEPGDLVLRVNDPADRFHIVTAGKLRIGISTLGRARFTLQTLVPGDVAGLSWMWQPRRWQWDVTAQDPSTTAAFDVAAVLDVCARDLEFKAAIGDVVAAELHERLYHARLQLLDMYGAPEP